MRAVPEGRQSTQAAYLELRVLGETELQCFTGGRDALHEPTAVWTQLWTSAVLFVQDKYDYSLCLRPFSSTFIFVSLLVCEKLIQDLKLQQNVPRLNLLTSTAVLLLLLHSSIACCCCVHLIDFVWVCVRVCMLWGSWGEWGQLRTVITRRRPALVGQPLSALR